MRNFDYRELTGRSWDSEIIGLVAQIHEYKGRQELYLKQKPMELDRLIEIAKVQSTEASNEIEGIRTTNTRLLQLVRDKTTPRNCDEEFTRTSSLFQSRPIISCSSTVICISIPIRALAELSRTPRTISAQRMQRDESLFCLHRLPRMKRLRQLMQFVKAITV